MAEPGRPSSYDPEYVKQAEKLCKLGATDLDIAQFFEVHTATIYRWKLEYPEFSEALKRGKEQADELVEDRLFKRATGYSHDATKIFQYEGAPITVAYIEHHAPDTTACIFWLKNRRPDRWRDVKAQEISGPSGGPVQLEEVKRTIVDPRDSDGESV